MKLYFYILPMGKEPESIIRTKEFEVEARGGLYYPVQGKFPVGYGYENRKNIGKLQRETFGYEKIYVVTQEPDLDLAKRLFIENINERIEEVHRKRIALLEGIRTDIETKGETRAW